MKTDEFLNPDEDDPVKLVFGVLLNVWEHTIRREDTLRMLLDEQVPGWRDHYLHYFETSETQEHADSVTAPFREMARQAIAGSLDYSSLQQLMKEFRKAPN